MAGLDREKSLDVALAQIEKAYGKGAVMRLGDEVAVPMKVIPTGSIALDVALGVGGLPRGRVVEIYGPESSGKCLTADTYLWTDRGLETIAELFRRCGQEATCTSRTTDISHLGVRVVNERGELEQVSMLTHNNRRPVKRLRLASGRRVDATYNHPLRVLNERGFIAWRKVGQLQAGDILVSAEFGAVEASGGDGLSEDLAVLLGYLVAESSREGTSPFVSTEFTGILRGLFGSETRLDPTLSNRLADEFGLVDGEAAGKTVPACVRTGGHKIQRAFLSSLFEGDGWIDASSTVGLATASEQLAHQVQLLLYGLGIPASVYRKFNTKYERHYWSVIVNPAVAHRFLDEVGFRSPRRAAQVQRCFRRARRDPQMENVSEPRYAYERIVGIEDLGAQPTFDIVVPGTHSFIANGVLSHNTTVALHAVAQAQAAGGIAAFIDAEHALDPDYARALGVNTDALLVSQPDTGEQALEIMDMLIRSGALDIIVVDSVAALVPRAEIEGEMGDSHVGLQARLMSQALRKITGALSNSGTTAIFINQLREKIGVMFGSPETTTGGKALKFYASIRLDVRRIETLKDGGDAVGNRTRVKVVKNKCLAEGSLVFDPATGRTHRIEDIVDNQLDVSVVAAAKDNTLHVRPVVSWFDQGEQNVLGLHLEGGNRLWVTPDHQVFTDRGWQLAGDLVPGDRLARPREFLGFGAAEPISPDHARVLGCTIGDADVESTSGVAAPEPAIPAYFFAPDTSAAVVGNLLSGLLEINGRASTEGTGAVRVGFMTTSQQLAHQVHWLLLRFGIASEVSCRRLRFEVRVSGSDNAEALARAIPTWGPRGQVLQRALNADDLGRRRGSQAVYLAKTCIAPVLAHLADRDISPQTAAALVGPTAGDPRGGMRQVLGAARLRRDRVQLLADALDDSFLQQALAEQVRYSMVREVLPIRRARTFDIEVEELHTFVADDVVVHNCAPPFKQAEFDIVYGQGISREGSLIDVGVEQGIVRKSGAWYTYEGDQLGQGKENVRAFLRDNPDLADEIEKKLKEKLGIGPKLDADAGDTGPGPSPVKVDF